MVDPASYLLGAVQLALVVLPIAFSAYRLRRRLLPAWDGASARLVESVTAVALLISTSELLGTFGLFFAGTLIGLSALIALVIWLLTAGGDAIGGTSPEKSLVATARGGRSPAAPEPARLGTPDADKRDGLWEVAALWLVIVIVAFSWALTAKHAVDRGIFNFDSLWYHMPFAVHMVQTHSVVGMDHVDTVFTAWFYPQNSELLHAVGILLTGRDTLSLFVNLGWLAVAFLAAYCVGRPYGRGAQTTVAAAILLGCHTLVVREPGAAMNDVATAALLLASVAILVEAWAHRQVVVFPAHPPPSSRRNESQAPRREMEPWALAAAALAAGLAAGTRETGLAMAGALSAAAVALAPPGRRRAAAGWWFVPALAGGAFWYVRNLIIAGNPIPQIEHVGPITLPHPEHPQAARPHFTVAHYATDTGVWRHYFVPGLHDAFGVLWPLVVFGAAAAALLTVFRGRDKVVRWVGAIALFGLLAYVLTPLSAAGGEGTPVGFVRNIRWVVPALLAAVVLVPLPRFFDEGRWRWWLIGALVLVFLITNRPDDALHSTARVFALAFAAVAILVPALLFARSRVAPAVAIKAAVAAVVLMVVAIGYPLQRHYLEGRFANTGGHDELTQGIDSAYTWARGIEDARIGLVGDTAGFASYGFYGTDLSNHVQYLGQDGPHGAFNAITTCSAFRAAVNRADLDYLVTAPGGPIPSDEARWLHDEKAVAPVFRDGSVRVWRIQRRLTPNGCGPDNAPMHEIPDTPRQ